MFNRYKIVLAKNRVIMELVQQGLVCRELEQVMRDIAGNAANVDYGYSLLQTKVAKCKYSAAAAIFARLALHYKVNPINDLTSSEWEMAGLRALVLAGASLEEAQQIMIELMEMNARARDQDPILRT